MGTLLNQSVKTAPRVNEYIIDIVSYIQKLTNKDGFTIDQSINIIKLAQTEALMSYRYDKYNAVDEQLAGFGEIASSIADSLAKLAEDRIDEP